MSYEINLLIISSLIGDKGLLQVLYIITVSELTSSFITGPKTAKWRICFWLIFRGQSYFLGSVHLGRTSLLSLYVTKVFTSWETGNRETHRGRFGNKYLQIPPTPVLYF